MVRPILVVFAILGLSAPALAQELEPRAYAANPIDVNFALVGYTYQWGGVVFDPSLPFSDVSAKINATTVGYLRTFSLFGRSANVSVGAGYAWGSVEGNVMEEFTKIHRSGLTDGRVKLAVNLLGGPAMNFKEFMAREPKTTLGFSMTVGFPSGQYSVERLINIGTNRWAFKPELGLSAPVGRWTFEAYAGVWFFTTNPDFYGGVAKEQHPLQAYQAHIGYNFTRTMWLALDATFYAGGQATVNGVATDTRQANSRVGLTYVFPVGRGQAIKLAYAKGATTRVGQDFQTIAVAYQLLWF